MDEQPRVIPLEYAREPRRLHFIWHQIGRICGLTGSLVAVVGLLAIFVEVRTVIASGSILGCLGVFAIVGGMYSRSAWTLGIGAAHLAICLLFVGLVNLLRWGPKDAEIPFIWMGSIYCLMIVVPTVVVFRSRPNPAID